MKKKLFLLSLAVATYFLAKPLDRFVERQTHSFTVCSISSRLKPNPEWETPQPSPDEMTDLHRILDQKFTYLNRGGQSFAFSSEDGQYVLKFFRLSRSRLPDGFMYMPLPSWLEPFRQKQAAKKHCKLVRDFTSYCLAYNELRDESGLVYLHLNATDFLKQTITIVDKLGIAHRISLDEKQFMIQKKVVLAYDAIRFDLQNNNQAGAKKKIDALLELTFMRYGKGIYDDDAFISKNYGFQGDQAIFLDIGRFQKNPECKKKEFYVPDFMLVTGRLRDWLGTLDPELIEHLDQKVKALCETDL